MKPLVCLLLFSTVAAAQPRNSAQSKTEKPMRIEYGDADELEGKRAQPEGALVTGKGRVKNPSLIRVRTDFYREMMARAEGL